MWEQLLIALALVLVIEGIMPFISPGSYRQTLQVVTKMQDKTLRWVGLSSMVAGVILLYIVH